MRIDRRWIGLVVGGLVAALLVGVAIRAARREAPRGSFSPSHASIMIEGPIPGEAEMSRARSVFAESLPAWRTSFMRSARAATIPLSESEAEEVWNEYIAWFGLMYQGSPEEWREYLLSRLEVLPPRWAAKSPEEFKAAWRGDIRPTIGASIEGVSVFRRAVRGRTVVDEPARPSRVYKNEVAGRPVDLSKDGLDACEVRTRGTFRDIKGKEVGAVLGLWLVRWPESTQWHPWGISYDGIPQDVHVATPVLP